ncbi:MAG: hypothetical protein QOJ91_867 [Sphingomonadales bacterium]|jgi:hypothetical protein|nr:hypothetical protein [Sphingomonadales bacterium]
MIRPVFLRLAAAAALALAAAAAPAQVTNVDPNSAAGPAAGPAEPGWEADQPEYQPVDSGTRDSGAEAPAPASPPAGPPATVPRDDVFSAAEGVFGKGAEGLGDIIEDLLRDRGDPTGYITGREAGGAFIAGVRYGSGILHHQIEGDRTVYWTGPSVGFDFGANADKVFVLVYNLNDSQRLFRRFPAAEGNAYVVGGFTASYLRRGDVVLIPVRLGVGARLGVNAGYMRFSQKNRWLPF